MEHSDDVLIIVSCILIVPQTVMGGCKSGSFPAYKPGYILCHFHPEFWKSMSAFQITYLVADGNGSTVDENVILACNLQSITRLPECTNLNPAQYAFEPHILPNNEVNLTVISVSPDTVGQYTCKPFPDYPNITQPCTLSTDGNSTLFLKSGQDYEDKGYKDRLNAVTSSPRYKENVIAVICCLALVCGIVGAFGYYCQKRYKTNGIKQAVNAWLLQIFAELVTKYDQRNYLSEQESTDLLQGQFGKDIFWTIKDISNSRTTMILVPQSDTSDEYYTGSEGGSYAMDLPNP